MSLASRKWISITSSLKESDALCSGSFQQAQTPVYFNRMDVKNAINAPNATEWTECTDTAVFPNGDASLPPAVSGVLANVIEKNNRTVIVHGLADFILMAEGYVCFYLLYCIS